MTIKNLEELKAFAKKFTADLKPGDVYGFSGELGAGKTTLVQMIGRELGIEAPMTSPTFVFRKEYPLGPRLHGDINLKKLVHIDAYRIERGNAEDLGDLQEPDAVTLIEWPEKIENRLPKVIKKTSISILPDESRRIDVD